MTATATPTASGLPASNEDAAPQSVHDGQLVSERDHFEVQNARNSSEPMGMVFSVATAVREAC